VTTSGPAQVPPSNSRGICPNNDNGHLSFGLDRVSITFPVRSWERDVLAWDRKGTTKEGTPEYSESLSTSVDVAPGAQLFVRVYQGESLWMTRRGRIDFNPARLLDPAGHGLAPVESLRDVVGEALGLVRGLVRPSCSLGDVVLTRLDVARDFEGVENPAPLLHALVAGSRKWARSKCAYFDPHGADAQTLSIGSGGAGMVRLYDKYVETGGAVPRGTVRFEAECRKPWLKNYGGITTLSDVGDERVEELARNRWEWSEMGRAVVGSYDEVVAAVEGLGLSGKEAVALLGWIVAQWAGGAIQPSSRTTVSKYRKLTRQAGVCLAVGEVTSRRLDFDLGTEVTGSDLLSQRAPA
jgi:hypothetical protein